MHLKIIRRIYYTEISIPILLKIYTSIFMLVHPFFKLNAALDHHSAQTIKYVKYEYKLLLIRYCWYTFTTFCKLTVHLGITATMQGGDNLLTNSQLCITHSLPHGDFIKINEIVKRSSPSTVGQCSLWLVKFFQ